jgi:pimeloyl-ACP methyl ester carboxylesterase
MIWHYSGLDVTLTDTGAGSRVVFVIHGGAGPRGVAPIVEHFTATARVVTPTHPGWDDTPRPEWFGGIDSLAITYLDLIDDLRLTDVTVVASSFGGWVAAEMAVRDRAHTIGRIVLLNSVGPEIDGYTMALPQGGPDLSLVQAYTTPTMNDPRLRRRLSRVDIPALLVWGEDDPIVPVGFGRAYADAFPNGRFATVPAGGHMPHLRDPDTTFTLIDEFVG